MNKTKQKQKKENVSRKLHSLGLFSLRCTHHPRHHPIVITSLSLCRTVLRKDMEMVKYLELKDSSRKLKDLKPPSEFSKMLRSAMLVKFCLVVMHCIVAQSDEGIKHPIPCAYCGNCRHLVFQRCYYCKRIPYCQFTCVRRHWAEVHKKLCAGNQVASTFRISA
mmetsp:Transcript_32385/g.60237  ORF Transcript_32385/g.60237 Transcript_32385/m.60237 type:complete len:164 (-) Transcript_32385:74-565(-)